MPEVLGKGCSDPSDSTANRRRRRSPARSDPAKPFTFVESANEIRAVCGQSFRDLLAHQTALDSWVSNRIPPRSSEREFWQSAGRECFCQGRWA